MPLLAHRSPLTMCFHFPIRVNSRQFAVQSPSWSRPALEGFDGSFAPGIGFSFAVRLGKPRSPLSFARFICCALACGRAVRAPRSLST
jgi:hypothetical protein